MKQLLFLCLLMPQFLLGQIDFQYVSPLEFANYNAVAADDAGNVVAAGSFESCERNLISFFDHIGALKWQLQNNTSQLNRVTDVIFDSKGDIVATGWERESDDIGSKEDGFFILKLNPSGDTLFYNKEINPYTHSSFVLENSDSTYLMVGFDHFFYYDRVGQLLREDSLGINFIDGIELGPNGNLLLYNREGGHLVDTGGNILASYFPEIGSFLDLAYRNDTTWLLDQNQLWQITSDEGLAKKIQLPVNSTKAKIAVAESPQGVLLATRDTLGNDLFFRQNLTNWDTIKIQPHLGTNVRDFVMKDGNFFVVGDNLWEIPPNHRPMYGAYLTVTNEAFPEFNDEFHDLSLESVITQVVGSVDTFDRVLTPVMMSTEVYAYGLFWTFEATVTVRNTGNTVIEEFVFFSERIDGFNCGQLRDYYYADSLNIGIGEEYSFTIPVSISYYDKVGDPPVNRGRCFYVAAPNLKFDDQIRNNHFCATLVNSVSESKLLNTQLNVFPNPVDQILNIQLDTAEPLEQVVLFDLQGKRLPVNVRLNGQEAQLNRGNLPAGVYFLKVFTKNGVGSQKVIFR